MDPTTPDASHGNAASQNFSPLTTTEAQMIKIEENEFPRISELPVTAPEALQIKTEPTDVSDISQLSLEEQPTLPSTVAEIARFQFHHAQANQKPVKMIGNFTVRIVRNKTDLEAEFPGAEEAVSKLLFCLRELINTESFSAQDEKALDIRFILIAIIGENPKARGPYAYPLAMQLQASEILEAVNERLPVIELAAEIADAVSATEAPPPRERAHKRRKTNPQDQQRALSISETTMKNVMRGISTLSNTGRRSYSLSDKSLARNCNVVGDNGIAVGTWWPYRICALRDGAHGASIAGIAGSVEEGAYSIVVSGQYADLDKDEGSVIYYSGSKSHDNEDPQNPIMTTSTRSLQTSKRMDRSVRVIRAAGGNARYAPSVGFRYDGLYKIIEEDRPKNRVGGRYVRFTLVRNNGQVEIDLSRPNSEERAIFNRLKEL